MKVREVIKRLKKDGWFMLARKGTNHKQFKHPSKPGRVTVSGNLGDDIAPETLDNILKQALLKGSKK